MLKNFISQIIKIKTQATNLPFWQWIERREKIRRLGNELNEILREGGELTFLKETSDMRRLVKIAKAQQELLQKKQ
jgi:hypothetical protein